METTAVPENDIRLTLMLHEDQVADFDDAWHLGDYGDGWGSYAIKADDPARDVPSKSASKGSDRASARSRAFIRP